MNKKHVIHHQGFLNTTLALIITAIISVGTLLYNRVTNHVVTPSQPAVTNQISASNIPVNPPVQKVMATTTTQTQSGPKDCGSDLQCFISEIPTCTSTTVINMSSADTIAILNTKAMLTLGKSTTSGLCSFTDTAVGITIEPDATELQSLKASGKTDAEIASMEQDLTAEFTKSEVGTKQQCDVPPAALATILGNWSKGNYNSDDFANYNCTTTTPDGQSFTSGPSSTNNTATNANALLVTSSENKTTGATTLTGLQIGSDGGNSDNSSDENYDYEVTNITGNSLTIGIDFNPQVDFDNDTFNSVTLTLNNPVTISGHVITLTAINKSTTNPNQFTGTVTIK